ncbi:MAG: cytoplasmic protein [Acidobacteriia bacterium]|nr:cytoplasmic protein [Terriglobia bacterium]
MNKIRLLSVCAVFAALLHVSVASVRAQDMVKVAPKNCTVVLDNDHVRVIRVVAKPGEKIAMHSHPATIVYSLTGGKSKFTFADGKTEERQLKAGQAIWSDADTHSNENIGTTETRVLVIELKQ